MEPVNNDKGAVCPPIWRSMGGVCPKILNCGTNKQSLFMEGKIMNKKMERGMQKMNDILYNAAINRNMEATVMMDNTTKNNDMEAETMTNENNRNMDNTGALDAMTYGNLAEMIPEDEQAVTEMSLAEENKIVVVGSIEPLPDLTSEIPEAERAEAEKPLIELAEAAEYGFFTPVAGMRGFITSTGHIIFAKICTEPAGQVIRYRQQYSNGRFSAEMTVEQADLAFAATYHFLPNKIANTKLRNHVDDFIMKVSLDYYGKLLYPKEGLDVPAILDMLVTKYEELPAEENVPSILEQPEKLYKKVIQVIKDKQLDIIDEHEAYYTLDKNQIDILANELGTSKNKLLKKMKEYRFLYLMDSSEGYQSYIRFKPYGEFIKKSYVEWCYCILKLDYLTKKYSQKTKKDLPHDKK